MAFRCLLFYCGLGDALRVICFQGKGRDPSTRGSRQSHLRPPPSWMENDSAWRVEGNAKTPPNFLTSPRQAAGGPHPDLHLNCIPKTSGMPAHVGRMPESRSRAPPSLGPAKELFRGWRREGFLSPTLPLPGSLWKERIARLELPHFSN